MKLVQDKKWRASFKKMHTHMCWVTGQQFTEYCTQGVTGAHITIGKYGTGIKDDQYIFPLRQDLHMIMDRGQEQFLIKHFDDMPQHRRDQAIDKIMERDNYDGRYSIVDVVKEMAKGYYQDWLDGILTF